jgi:hypothetical protein
MKVESDTLYIESSYAVVQFDLSELFDLLFQSEKELESIDIFLSDIMVRKDMMTIDGSGGVIRLEGTFILSDIEKSLIRSIDASFDSIVIGGGQSLVESFAASKSTLSVRGMLTAEILSKEVNYIISNIDSIDLATSMPKITLQEGPTSLPSWLIDEKNLSGEKINLRAHNTDNTLYIDSFETTFPLISMGGDAQISMSETISYDIKLHVSYLEKSVKDEFNPLLMFMGYYIPEGPFTLLAQQVIGEGPLDFSITED